MFYVIETDYVGPNANQHADAHRIDIATEPALGNTSHEPVINGWCGTTNDWSVHAHGAFDTIEAARDKIASLYPETRDNEYLEPDVVESYRIGKYEPMTFEHAEDWFSEVMGIDITANTTDAEIEALAETYEDYANDEGYTVKDVIVSVATKFRDNEIEAAAE